MDQLTVSKWISCNVPYTSGAMKTAGLLKTGTILKFSDGTVFVVGDINEEGGTCNHCDNFNAREYVVAYAKLSV